MGEHSMRSPDKGLLLKSRVDRSYFNFTHVRVYLPLYGGALPVP